jgi:hypothetical protein
VALDSIPPTVATTAPANGDEVAVTDRTLSITFSEKIKIVCPGYPDAQSSTACLASGSAVTAQGSFNDSSDRGTPGDFPAKLYAYIAPFSQPNSAGTITLSGDLVGSAQQLNRVDNITVTVDKDWISDVNGNHMESDYVFTFTTPSL